MLQRGGNCYAAALRQRRRSPAFAANDDAVTIAGSYDFGILRLALMYEHLKYETPTGDLKRDMWGISTTIPMGGGLWYIYYGNAGDGKGGASDSESRINSLVHGADSGSQNFEIGYRYDLSKRTSLNAGYVYIKNDARANYTFNVNGYAVDAGRRSARLRAGHHPQLLNGQDSGCSA